MVVSRLDPALEYKENKEIEENDKSKDVSLYGMNIKGLDLVIAVGEIKDEYKKFDITYVPVYLIVDEKEKIYQIGIYEFMSSSYSSLIDEEGDLDISKIEGPILFSFVTKEYLKECIGDTDLPVDEDYDLKSATNLDNLKKSTIVKELEIEEDDDDIHQEEETLDDNEKYKKKYNPRKSSIWIRAFLHNDLYDIKNVESNGDCLFATIREGFKDTGRHIKVNKLRGIVADYMNHKNFEAYTEYYDMTQKGIDTLNREIDQGSKEGTKIKKEYLKIKKDLTSGLYDRVDKYPEKKGAMEKAENLKKKLLEKHTIHKKKQQELLSLQDIGSDYKWMKGITTLEKLRKYVRTCKFWADGSAISILEEVLNIKLIILSSLKYKNKEMNTVLSCGDMDTIY
ncbi:MAG: hypothetical protein CXT73_07265 [Methanobacteriota archaeon]|nr:MAG: hypothetical protein CXT73_07265 [Euryarchaeota archaeon]